MRQISPAQIRMARACLEWSQDNLAAIVNVARSTIQSLESGFAPRPGTIDKIRKVFESAGIEFLEGDSVRRRNDMTNIYQGADSCDRLFEEILNDTRQKNFEVLVLLQAAEMLTQPSGAAYQTNLERLELINENTNVRCILSGDIVPSFIMPSFEIRTAASKYIGPSSYYVFGDKQAMVFKQSRTSFALAVFHIAAATEDYRNHFNTVWAKASPLKMQTGKHVHGSPLVIRT